MALFQKYKTLYESSMLENAKLISAINSGAFNPVIASNFDKIAYETMLTTKDMVLCCNRYIWDLQYLNITSQQLETLFYKNFSVCLFENDLGQLQFSSFTKVGDLDVYGRLQYIQPIDYAGKSYGPIRSVIHANNASIEKGTPTAVIICDYTTSMACDSTVSRAQINKSSTIADEVMVYKQLMNNVALSIKKALALCDSNEQQQLIAQQVAQLLDPDKAIVSVARTEKNGVQGFESPVEMFNLNNNFDTQNYCQTIEFYDKTRRNYNGIPTPDTFEKKERKITAEAENTSTHTNLVLLDGYLNRLNGLTLFQKYCLNPENKKISVIINPLLDPFLQKEEEEKDQEKEDNKEEGKEQKDNGR